MESADPLAAAGTIISEALSKKLAIILSIQHEDVDVSKPLHAHGVNSLLAAELRTWFVEEIGAEVPIFDILGNNGIDSLSLVVAEKSQYCQSLHATVEN